MAEITCPEAIKFANEQLRPMAERLRDLNALMDALNVIWAGGGVSAYFSEASDTLEDGREAQGVSRLTGADVMNFVSQVQTIIAQFDGVGVMDVINKPCVRAMVVGE